MEDFVNELSKGIEVIATGDLLIYGLKENGLSKNCNVKVGNILAATRMSKEV